MLAKLLDDPKPEDRAVARVVENVKANQAAVEILVVQTFTSTRVLGHLLVPGGSTMKRATRCHLTQDMLIEAGWVSVDDNTPIGESSQRQNMSKTPLGPTAGLKRAQPRKLFVIQAHLRARASYFLDGLL